MKKEQAFLMCPIYGVLRMQSGRNELQQAGTRPKGRTQPLARALLAVGIAAAPMPAHAFELFGIRLFGKDKQETVDTIGTPQNYAVEFITEGGDDELESDLKKASSLWQDRNDPASGAGGLIAKARGDYRTPVERAVRQCPLRRHDLDHD